MNDKAARSVSVVSGFTLSAVLVAGLLGCVGDEPQANRASDAGAASDTATPQDGTTADGARVAVPPIEDGGRLSDGDTDAGTDASASARCSPDGGWGTPEAVADLNDGHRNHAATLSYDERTVYFSSNRLSDGGAGYYAGFDLFTATRATASGPFSGVRLMPVSASGDVPDMFPSELLDGLTLYFDSYRTNQTRQVWTATRTSTATDYANAEPVSAINDGGGENGDPYALPNGSAIYFASNRAGGAGSFDLYEAPVTGGVVGAPIALGGLNTASAEQYVAPTPDDLTLYFGSARDHSGYDMDIFVATRTTAAQPFGTPQKLPDSINVHADWVTANYPTYITRDGCVLYFTRANVQAGRAEIWRVARQ
jgi:hypothetical protein